LSDHPNPGNRRTAIQTEIKDWPSKQYSGNTAQFTSARQHATGVRAYNAKEIADGAKSGQWTAENRKNGAVFPDAPSATAGAGSMPAVSISSVQPSSTFQTATLAAGLSIARPQNWEVLENKQASATIAPRAGASNGGVAYGVVIGTTRAPSANMSASQLTTAIAQNLQSGDTNMRAVGQVQPITVAGGSGGSVQLETISPMAGSDGKTQRERDWLVTVQRGGDAVFFVFVSTTANYEQFRPTFERMLKSVQFR
jgi:hypothetical protein